MSKDEPLNFAVVMRSAGCCRKLLHCSADYIKTAKLSDLSCGHYFGPSPHVVLPFFCNMKSGDLQMVSVGWMMGV